MGDISEQKLATTDSFHVFGGSFPARPLPEILIQHNIKETASKGNIWGPFYIPKDEGSDGGSRIRKYYIMNIFYRKPNPNNLFRIL